MSKPIVEIHDAGKMYKIFSSKTGTLVDALGLPGRRRASYREFWALRGIDISLHAGERLGIIGRNGAGKSTLLRLITENIEPTEGTVRVRGQVQALLETGGGLHPEFTGHENIRAALSFLGLNPREVAKAEAEIAEFTELGRFLDQPFKTYSTGMQTRLAFAIATTIEPEILIVDEVLGAGDAYFFAKSAVRMRELLEGGAAVLLVSHALDQVVRFCTEAIWLDRGRVVMRGPSTEVVKAYEKFIRQLEDRRLRARNQKSLSDRYDAFERESYTDHLVVSLDEGLDVDIVELFKDGELEDSVDVGGPQDVDASHSAMVVAGPTWSEPLLEGDRLFRSVRGGSGAVLFNLWLLQAQSSYSFRMRARGTGNAVVRHGDHVLGSYSVAAEGWTWVSLDVDSGRGQEASISGATWQSNSVSRWPGEGTLLIERVRLESDGKEAAVFAPRSPLTLTVEARAREAGVFPVTPSATIYRSDGILATNLVGPCFELEAAADGVITMSVSLNDLNLGDGRYLVSLGLYRHLDDVSPQVFDLLDRSYEFEVRGNGKFDNGVFVHEAIWTAEARSALGIGATVVTDDVE